MAQSATKATLPVPKSPAALEAVKATMAEFKAGKLKTSTGAKVTSKPQALAIAVSQGRRAHEAEMTAMHRAHKAGKVQKAEAKAIGRQMTPEKALKAARGLRFAATNASAIGDTAKAQRLQNLAYGLERKYGLGSSYMREVTGVELAERVSKALALKARRKAAKRYGAKSLTSITSEAKPAAHEIAKEASYQAFRRLSEAYGARRLPHAITNFPKGAMQRYSTTLASKSFAGKYPLQPGWTEKGRKQAAAIAKAWNLGFDARGFGGARERAASMAFQLGFDPGTVRKVLEAAREGPEAAPMAIHSVLHARGYNPAGHSRGTKMPATAMTLHKPVSQSPAYKSMQHKLEDARDSLSKRMASLREAKAELEKGAIPKIVALAVGGAVAALAPGAFKRADGTPYLGRQARRLTRLGVGVMGLWKGRKVHPLIPWAAAGLIVAEIVFSALEWSKRGESGVKADIGAPAASDDFLPIRDDFSGAAFDGPAAPANADQDAFPIVG